jgi:UPF0755 protein
MMRRLVYLVAGLALAGILAGAGFFYLTLQRPYKGYAGAEQFVEIPPGTALAEIGHRLVEGGVVKDRATFRYAIWATGDARRLQAGEYRFDRPMTAVDVVRKIARGEVYLRPITFREGLTIREMARTYEERGFGTADDFRRAAGHAALIADLDPAARDLEGYLFPETYALPRRATAATLVQTMVQRFRKHVADLQADVTASGRTVREVVTLASIVERETGKGEERPLIAAVYLNRLRIGMGLQCDPTVIYALERAGRYTGNLTRDDLAFDSPYNTYRYAGLPPGPIAAPGRASLDAAVHPASVPYLYFVSRNDGSHVFATTLEEHNRNVQEYQIRYFREQRRAR